MKNLEFAVLMNMATVDLYPHPREYLQALETNEDIQVVSNEVLNFGSIEERIVKTYFYMQDEVPYVSDPVGIDLIRKPLDTFLHGGDCEDLTLLAIQFFNEMDINSYFVLAPRHVFSLVGPVDEKKLLSLLPKSSSYNIRGYYFDDGFYVYFDPAVRGNAYPGFIDLSYLRGAVIADVKTKEIVRTIGSGLNVREYYKNNK
jgi:hypothetical protein